MLQAYVHSFLMSQSLAKYRHDKKKQKAVPAVPAYFEIHLNVMLADPIINQKHDKKQTNKKHWIFNWENKSLVVLHAYLCFVTSWVRSGLKTLHLCEEGITDINKKLKMESGK